MPERLFSATWIVQRAIKEVDSAFAFVNEILPEHHHQVLSVLRKNNLASTWKNVCGV
jgi:hypothetical protein